MPEHGTINGVKICVYSRDHVPPQVHCIAGDDEVLLVIKTQSIYEGYLPKKKLAVAKSYVEQNATELLELFYILNPMIKKV